MRRIFTIISALLIATTLTACGAGQNAATRKITQVTDGVESSITQDGNNIKIVNLLVVAAPGGNAVLVGTIVNNGDQEDLLLGVAINGTTTTYTGINVLPKNTPIIFEGERANAKATLGGFGAPAGSRVQVGLFFAKAGVVNLDAIVREARDEYAGITAGEIPPTPTPSPTATK